MINIYRMNFCAKVLNSVQICFHLGAFFILIKGLLSEEGRYRNFFSGWNVIYVNRRGGIFYENGSR